MSNLRSISTQLTKNNESPFDEEIQLLNDKTFKSTTLPRKHWGLNGFTQLKVMQMRKKNSMHGLLARVTAR